MIDPVSAEAWAGWLGATLRSKVPGFLFLRGEVVIPLILPKVPRNP